MKPDPSIDEPFLVEEPGAAQRQPAGAPHRFPGDTVPRAKGRREDFYVVGEREAEDTEPESAVGSGSRTVARPDEDGSVERGIRTPGDTEAGGAKAWDMQADNAQAMDAEDYPLTLPAAGTAESDTHPVDAVSAKSSGARGDAAASGAGNEPAATPPPRKRSKAAAGVNNVLTGDILSHKGLRRWYPFILYCVVLVFVYITHVFYIHRLETTRIREEIELNALRQKSLVYSADRMNATRQSRILEQVRQRGLGLQESLVPPKIIEP